MGDRGSLSLFGRNPATHRLLAHHLLAEYRIKTEGRGRVVDEWKIKPEHFDNHWLDCIAGAAVAASIDGVSLEDAGAIRGERRERVKLSDLQKRKWGKA